MSDKHTIGQENYNFVAKKNGKDYGEIDITHIMAAWLWFLCSEINVEIWEYNSV